MLRICFDTKVEQNIKVIQCFQTHGLPGPLNRQPYARFAIDSFLAII